MKRPEAFWIAGLGVACLVANGCSKHSLPTGPVADLITGYEFASAWGDSGGGNGQFYYPQGVAVDGSGNVYVVDTVNHRIQKFAPDGSYLTQWGTLGNGIGQFEYMNSIAVDAGGSVYVADSQNNRVQKFTGDGTYLMQWPVPRTRNIET